MQPCQPLGSGIQGSFGLATIVISENEFCQNLMSQDTITTTDSESYESIGGRKHSLDQDWPSAVMLQGCQGTR